MGDAIDESRVILDHLLQGGSLPGLLLCRS